MRDRDVPGRRGDAHRPAAWVRTRLRSARAAALLTAVLTLATVFTAAALPRAADRGADSAVARFVLDRGVGATSLHLTARPRPGTRAADLDTLRERLVARIGSDLPLTRDGEHHGTRALTARPILGDGYDRPGGIAPQLHLTYLQGLAGHATLTEGSWPGPALPGEPLPIVVSARAAESVRLKVGDLLDGGSDNGADAGAPLRARIVGLYRADAPRERYWQELPCPDRACLKTLDGGGVRWETGGFVGPDALAALLAWGGGGEDFWRLPLDPHALRADRLAELRSGLGSHLAGPGAVRAAEETARPDLSVSTLLPEVLADATARHRATAPLAAIGPAGVAGTAAVVLCLAAALAADRRAAELRLLRARGASRTGILLRLLGEYAVTVLPAAAAGTALAVLLLPAPRWTASALAAGATALFALLAFPLRATLLPPRPPGTTRTRRRLVGELLTLTVTAAAVAEVRRRGAAPPGDAPDPLLVTAPLLVALTGGLLLARVQPWLVGRLAAGARRGRGLIGFLGLARTARDTAGRHRPAVLPTLALLLAVTTAGFGATVLDTTDGARLRAARTAIGGDAAVLVPPEAPLPEPFLTAAAALPGVRAASPVRIERQTYVLGVGRLAVQATAVIVEPRAYAEIARTVGVGPFDPDTLAAPPGGPDTPVPALVSPGLAERLPPGPQRLRTPGGELLATAAGTLAATPALPEAIREFLVLPVGPASARLPDLARADAWLAVGEVDGERLRSLFVHSGLADATGLAELLREEAREVSREPDGIPDGYRVRTSREVDARLAADPLQASTVRLFRTAAAAGAGFALLAVLLTVLRASPERAALLARLRTMGLRPRQGLALILAETVPQALAAVAAGAAVAAAAVALLGPAFDLSPLVGATVDDALSPLALPVLRPAAALALLVCAAVALEALVSGRRQVATELRAGERN
ncbi:hypothetical protein ABT093_17530 [Kitasatospora sp. NPDC002551]|uniref:hypothetical protein n=1 Tax=Kitasatospora sp. NPDC002551 TaxID=3154539 RepID=UPI00332F5FB7